MDETRHESRGLLATGKRILRTVYRLAETRFELFLVELQEERVRVFDALLLVGSFLLCAFMALALLTVTVVVIFWEQNRVAVLAVLTLTYAGAAGWSFWTLRRRLQDWHSFEATLAELKKDQACLEKNN